MKNKIYYYAYKLHISWMDKVIISIRNLYVIAMPCQSINADRDSRILYDLLNDTN